MNRKGFLILLFIALFCATGFAGDLSGKIVYLDGNKAASYDLKTGSKGEVASFEDGKSVEYLVASENGATLAWHNPKDGKIYTKKLPNGEAVPVKVQSQIVPGRDRPVLDLQVPKITGLAISPDGEKIAYSFPTMDKAFVSPSGRKSDSNVLIEQPAPCQAVNVFSARYVNFVTPAFFGIAPAFNESWQKMGQCQFGMFGHPAVYPCKAPYRASTASGSTMGYPMTPKYFNFLFLPWQQTVERMGEQSDAVLSVPAFTKIKGQLFIALMRSTANGFGPVEIYDLGDPKEINKMGKPGWYEIRCRFAVFFGLAWGPDGSLLIKGDKGSWKIAAEQIEQGIQNSSIGFDTNSVNIANKKIGFMPFGEYRQSVAVNNTFVVKPQPFGLLDPARNICCDSKTSALSLRADGNVHRFEEGEGDKVLFSSPSAVFSFCPAIISQPEKPKVATATQDPSAYADAVLKSSKNVGIRLRPVLVEKTIEGRKTKASGTREMLWNAHHATLTDSATGQRVAPTHAYVDLAAVYNQDRTKKDGVELIFQWVLNRHIGDAVSYALPEETDLQKIDPLKLKYTPAIMPFTFFVKFDQVIVLEYKTLYIGIKPLRILTPRNYKLPKGPNAPDIAKKIFGDGKPLEIDYLNWYLSNDRLEGEYNIAWQQALDLLRENSIRNAENKAKKTLR